MDKLRQQDNDDSAEVGVSWVGIGRKTPVILFSAAVAQGAGGTQVCKRAAPRSAASPSGPLRLAFKAGEGEIMCTVLKSILLGHGFCEVPSDSGHFNLVWTGLRLKPLFLKRLQPHQKMNHFPSSFELTKKDRLCENVHRMQRTKGVKHFNIIPKTFVLPNSLTGFLTAFRRHRGTWIVKPVGLSRGRGISLIDHPNQIPKETGTIVVSRYVEKPLCIDGFKFDVRLYVAVTSFNPLRIYLYEEGLTRFATDQYLGASQQLGNLCMHLTNYSVNKLSSNYVRCEDPDVEDFGNKWSMSAMLRHLEEVEGLDVAEVMMRVEDVIIKTILCGEVPIVATSKAYQPHRRNCFELFGFDVLIDERLQPWVLEVNLSPSLACDAPLDLRLKSNLVSDLLSLVGIVAQDAYNGERKSRFNSSELQRGERRSRSGSARGLTSEEAAILRETKEEHDRRGGFLRIFPSYHSWELYGSFIHSKALNLMLHSHLYPDNVKSSSPVPCSLASVNCKRFKEPVAGSSVGDSSQGLTASERVAVYLRKLDKDSSHTERASPAAAEPPVSDCSTRPPEAPPTQDTLGSLECVDSACCSVVLSKLQARQVFASYLDRVQERFLRETSTHDYQQAECEEEQKSVDLVMRFLTKASANLESPFTVVAPNKQLALSERKRILARQLAQFVGLYQKETCLLVGSDKPISNGPSAETFQTFLSVASEAELERLLAAYAQQNKSSSPFTCTAAKEKHEPTAPSKNGMHQRTGIERAPLTVLCDSDLPQYSPEMLPASGLSLAYQQSLEKLTKSLAGWQANQTSAQKKTGDCLTKSRKSSSPVSRTTTQNRSLSALSSTHSGSSVLPHSVPSSQSQSYISPYARTGSRQPSSRKNKSKTVLHTTSAPPSHPRLKQQQQQQQPAMKDSSISQALHGLTLKQNARKYAAAAAAHSSLRPVA